MWCRHLGAFRSSKESNECNSQIQAEFTCVDNCVAAIYPPVFETVSYF